MHPSDVKEFLDGEEELRRKVKTLATWLRQAKHAVAFTGAGISTAAGIPDFRSGMDTIADSGPGVWELAARGLTPPGGQRRCSRTTLGAIPTTTHILLVEMEKRGLIKHLVSVNTDGLHRRSGFPATKLSELYGNINTERCSECKKTFLRDYFTRRMSNEVHDHATGRICHCGGALQDTIVNFNEPLTVNLVRNNLECCDPADLCLAMGSSLQVAPGGDIPTMVCNKGGRLVIVNLQATPMDVNADLIIHAKCEDVTRLLMQELGIAVPPWKLRREIVITTTPIDASSIGGNVCTIVVEGRNSEGHLMHFIKDIAISSPASEDLRHKLHDTPMGQAIAVNNVQEGQALQLEMSFFGHFDEPPMAFTVQVGSRSTHHAYTIQLDPRDAQRRWQVLFTPELS